MQTLEHHLGELVLSSEIEGDAARRVSDRFEDFTVSRPAGA